MTFALFLRRTPIQLRFSRYGAELVWYVNEFIRSPVAVYAIKTERTRPLKRAQAWRLLMAGF